MITLLSGGEEEEGKCVSWSCRRQMLRQSNGCKRYKDGRVVLAKALWAENINVCGKKVSVVRE